MDVATIDAGLLLSAMTGFGAVALMWWQYPPGLAPKLSRIVPMAFGGLASAFMCMLLAVPIAWGLPGAEDGLVGAFVTAFFSAGFVEETVKGLFTAAGLWNKRWRRHLLDGPFYGAIVGAGFGLLENFAYLLQYQDDLETLAFMRACWTVPGHAANSALLGYYLARMRLLKDRDRARKEGAIGLATAVGFHGLYDFVIFVGWGWPAFPLVILNVCVLYGLVLRAQRLDAERVHNPDTLATRMGNTQPLR